MSRFDRNNYSKRICRYEHASCKGQNTSSQNDGGWNDRNRNTSEEVHRNDDIRNELSGNSNRERTEDSEGEQPTFEKWSDEKFEKHTRRVIRSLPKTVLRSTIDRKANVTKFQEKQLWKKEMKNVLKDAYGTFTARLSNHNLPPPRKYITFDDFCTFCETNSI